MAELLRHSVPALGFEIAVAAITALFDHWHMGGLGRAGLGRSATGVHLGREDRAMGQGLVFFRFAAFQVLHDALPGEKRGSIAMTIEIDPHAGM
jgi:hypothetical protein